MRLFGKKPKEASRRVVALSHRGDRSVVGESYYQDALRETSRNCIPGPGGRRKFTATLVREPENEYDANAVAVHSAHGKIGHLSREDALAYQPVFEEVARRGYEGGTCEAFLIGGEPGKASFGAVLWLADPTTCAAELGRPEDAATP
jgi:hypothetical protein